jgi:DNA-directed RNA polymerase specialized sigma24 family protein
MQTLRAIDYAALPEAALAAQARTADPDAFREIMRRCNQRLFRVARSLVHEDAEAEDVLQEAYACAFAHIAEFRGVFILREIQELSVEETAADLGIRPETVKTRLHRARRLLRQALDEKLAGVLVGAYPFLGARCERITETVLARMASPAA